MKIKFLIYLMIPVAIFTSCNKTEFDAIPVSELMGDSLITTYSIEQLKAEFMTNKDPYSDATGQSGLYTSDLIQSASDVVISGFVTSTDIEGNVYKYFVVQEDKPNGQALKVSIDASGLSAIYPLGQQVWIRCNDLYIGKYGHAPQLGSLYINKERVNVYNGDSVYRIEPGRMPLFSANEHVHSYGMPQADRIKADTMTIAQIKAADYTKLVNKLVCIKNAYFTGFDGNKKALSAENMIFAPSTGGVGYPQLRNISDGTGDIAVATSEYAKFATKPIPPSNYSGNITVIIGWYKNYADAAGVYQLTLRTLGDLGKGFEPYLTSVDYTK